MLIKLINYFIGSFFIVIATYYVAVKIIDRKFEIFKFQIIKYLIFETIIISIMYFFIPNSVVRLIINVIVLSFFYKRIFQISFNKCLTMAFLFFLLNIFSEIIFIIFNLFVYKMNFEFIMNNIFMSILTNIGITFLIILLIQIKKLRNIFRNLLLKINFTDKFNLLSILFVSILCLSFLIYYLYFEPKPLIGIFINLFLVLCYTIFIICLIKEKNSNSELRLEYEAVLKNIENYEEDLSEQRMKNHENKNILISIKGMVKKENIELRNFLNQIIDDNKKDDKNILYLTSNIPTGGLQGLIYQKLLLMKDKSIVFSLNVDKSINKSSLEFLPSETIKNICMIVGVFIDNSIQEVDKYEKKIIGIQLFENENNIIIEIFNNYKGILELDSFSKKGYTTKNKGHGYGLSLVKEIIDSDDNLENMQEINGDLFSQKLIIKNKTTHKYM